MLSRSPSELRGPDSESDGRKKQKGYDNSHRRF